MITRDVAPIRDTATKVKERATQLNDIEDELDRCDPLTPQHVIFYGPEPRASSTPPNSA